MVSYPRHMPNTRQGAKAVRQSKKKQEHNLFWKRRVKAVMKSLNKDLETTDKNADILLKGQSALQKIVDKAAKEKAIHKNKANRLKAKYANKIAVHLQKEDPTTKPSGSSKATAKPTKKSKSSK